MKVRGANPDTKRLDTLIRLFDDRSSDFEQFLFFARKARKTDRAAFRLALDRWRADRGD